MRKIAHMKMIRWIIIGWFEKCGYRAISACPVFGLEQLLRIANVLLIKKFFDPQYKSKSELF